MQILTLITDWGYKDFYTGKFKGRFFSSVADVQIVDITHGIRKYEKKTAAFIASQACFEYPAKTIHVIDVASNKNHVLVVCEDQYFLCSDNKIPSWIFHDKKVEIYSLNELTASLDTANFIALDIYIPVIKMLVKGINPSKIGIKIEKFAEFERISRFTMLDFHPKGKGKMIECHSICVDDYGNTIIDITKKEFDEFLLSNETQDFYIEVDLESPIEKISSNYRDESSDTDKWGEPKPILSVSASGYLEIALCDDNFHAMSNKNPYGKRIIPRTFYIYSGKPKQKGTFLTHNERTDRLL